MVQEDLDVPLFYHLSWHCDQKGGIPVMLGLLVLAVVVAIVVCAIIFHGLNFCGVMVVTVMVSLFAASLEWLLMHHLPLLPTQQRT